jgi:hypothetical protein
MRAQHRSPVLPPEPVSDRSEPAPVRRHRGGIKEFLNRLKIRGWLSSQTIVREFISKSVAAGLSTGVVLLWWPVLFDRVDSVTSWFARGVTWTVLFEVLLLALVPFERALWETDRGERLSGRVAATQSRLHSGSHRRKLSRLSALAGLAVFLPVALLATGLHQGAAQAQPVKVVRVTKVVKVLQHAPVQRTQP